MKDLRRIEAKVEENRFEVKEQTKTHERASEEFTTTWKLI